MPYEFVTDTSPLIIPEDIGCDNGLSLQAKGLYLVLIGIVDPSYPFCSINEITEQSSNGIESTRTAIKELECCGLLTRTRSNKRMVYEVAHNGCDDYRMQVLELMQKDSANA